MFAWVALDRITRAYYDRYQCAIYDGWVAIFIGPAYQWQGNKVIPCKTEEEAAKGVQSFYEQFCEMKHKEESPLQG